MLTFVVLQKLVDKLEKEGYLVCTPSRETDTARIASYDDK